MVGTRTKLLFGAGISSLLLAAAVATVLSEGSWAPGGEALPDVSAPPPAAVPTGATVVLAPADDPLDALILPEPQLYYQYVDADGSVRFARSLLEVPAEWRSRAGRVVLDVAPPSTPAEARLVRKLR